MIGSTAQFRDAAAAALRSPTQRTEVAWTKEIDPSITFFTLDTSKLDGLDVLAGEGEDIANVNRFEYFDETERIISIEIQSKFNEPVASFGRAVADIVLDNYDGRYNPEGDSEIAAFVKVNRPFKLSLGFNFSGSTELLQKFIGFNRLAPKINRLEKTVTIQALDLASDVWDTPVSGTVIFIDETVSNIIKQLLMDAGWLEDQIDLDPSENKIAFCYFERSMLLGDAIGKLTEADLGIFYVDEKGIARYRSRDWFTRSAPVSAFEITDDMVITESDDDATNIINQVEVIARPRSLRSSQKVYELGTPVEIAPGESVEFFIEYPDPVIDVIQPVGAASDTSSFYANTSPSNAGIDYTANVSISDWDDFAIKSKVTMTNSGDRYAYVTELLVWARPAKQPDDAIQVLDVDEDSIEEYGKYAIKIENDYIQSALRARNMAAILLADRKLPSAYRKMEIIGQPQLQMGDTVIRSGITYNIVELEDKLTTDDGLMQNLTLVSRDVQTYFRLDISNLDGNDTLAI